MRLSHTISLLFTLFASTALAEQTPPPPLPEAEYTAADDALQPEVSITRQGKQVVKEYRRNGQLYMIKVIPSKGKPYYLIDSDGDGSLESRRDSLDDPEVAQWRIFEW